MEVVDQASKITLLSSIAFENTKAVLSGYKIILDSKHENALKALAFEMAEISLTEKKSRTVFSFGTGVGKTTSVIGFISAIHQLDLPVYVSVCAEQVEALCTIKRALIKEGVPEDKIALPHSKSNASEPATPKDQVKFRQFALVTHSRVKSAHTDTSQYHHYVSEDSNLFKSRNLVIWDESLLISEGESLLLNDIRGEIGNYLGRYRNRLDDGPQPTLSQTDLNNYFKEILSFIESQMNKESPGLITFPDLELDLYSSRKALNGIFNNRKVPTALEDLLVFSTQKHAKIINLSRSALVQYKLTVPYILDKMVILDASYPIRHLFRLDPTITWDLTNDLRVDYSDVTIHYWNSGAGRNSLEKRFKTPRNAVSEEIVDIIQTILKETKRQEPILIFTHKDQKKPSSIDIPSALKLILEEEGIDLEMRNKDGDKLINILTWGRERSTNEFSNCKHIIFAGILYKPEETLAAHASGQLQNDSVKIDKSIVKKIQESEQAHLIYQALSRGNSRNSTNGKAGKMDVYLFHHQFGPIQALLTFAMPGVIWKARYPNFMGKNHQSRGEKHAKTVANHLCECDETEIPSRELWEMFPESQGVIKAARKLIPSYTDFQWKFVDRTCVKQSGIRKLTLNGSPL